MLHPACTIPAVPYLTYHTCYALLVHKLPRDEEGCAKASRAGLFHKDVGHDIVHASGMGSMSFGATMGRTAAGDFGMTQPAVPPLCIDPIVTAMLQRAGAEVLPSQPQSTSPAFAVRSLAMVL